MPLAHYPARPDVLVAVRAEDLVPGGCESPSQARVSGPGIRLPCP
jgi:hypothetical protein